jgi:hypothetical protein
MDVFLTVFTTLLPAANVSKITKVVGEVKDISLKGTLNPKVNSAAAYGRYMHSIYKISEENGVTKIKEYGDISGIRPDFVDFETKTIYELKPNNQNAISKGNKQLNKYIQSFKDVGLGDFKGVLETYNR